MIKIINWFLFFLMTVIIVLGLKWTGFVRFFPKETNQHLLPEKEQLLKNDQSAWSESSVPQLNVKDIKNKKFSLENLKGQVVLLNFWASWCLPCLEEFPELLSTVQWSKGKIALVAVSNDSSQEDIKRFLNKLERAKNVDLDQKGIYIIWDADRKIAGKFHTIKLPETFILSKDLKIMKKQAGKFSFKELKPFLQELMNQETGNP